MEIRIYDRTIDFVYENRSIMKISINKGIASYLKDIEEKYDNPVTITWYRHCGAKETPQLKDMAFRKMLKFANEVCYKRADALVIEFPKTELIAQTAVLVNGFKFLKEKDDVLIFIKKI